MHARSYTYTLFYTWVDQQDFTFIDFREYKFWIFRMDKYSQIENNLQKINPLEN